MLRKTTKSGVMEKIMGPSSKHKHKHATLIWRAINGVMSFFFFLCSIVQFNDPDPYLWVPFYCIPACLCASIVWKPDVVENKYWRVLSSLHIAISCFSSIVLILQLVHYFREEIINPLRFEEGREMLGVIIAICWIVICRFCNPKKSDGSQQIGAMMTMVVIIGFLPFAIWIASCLDSYHHCGNMWAS
ncbi:transmembrane protein 220-like [Antedon mediterranea]|uniref:transmembrane protein 220-like n=1 Tax=Antedon mediterranea TaxID=105859 RepID=UPI003AF87065